jgi:hypothetical protein
MNRRTKVLLGCAGAVLAVLVFALASSVREIRSTQTTAPGPVPEQRSSDTSQPSPGLSAFRDEARSGPLDFSLPPGQRGPDAVPPALGASAANEYRKLARLPESTRALEGDADPVAESREVTPAHAAGPNGADPALTAFPSQVSYEAPERVVLYAFFTSGGRNVPAESLGAELLSERRGSVAKLVMNDEGRDGDETAGDLVYSASWQPPDKEMSELRGSYVASVRGTAADLEERAVGTGFLYSVPLARPTGRFRDTLVDGSLRLDVEIEVFAAGRFHAEAVLASQSGSPIAWAQNARAFEPGMQWLPIDFYGLVFREKGIDGPYVLSSLALSTTGEMPNQKNRLLRDAYTTRAYAAADFTDRPFEDPGMVEAARRAERDAPAHTTAGP